LYLPRVKPSQQRSGNASGRGVQTDPGVQTSRFRALRTPMKNTKRPSSGFPVHCAHDRMVQVAQVMPHPKNPTKHPDRQIELLARMIKHQGWRSPIVISQRSGYVVSGHARLQAARLLGCKSVPVNYQDFKSDADEWAHLVADNRIAELADLKTPELRAILDDLRKLDDFDLTLSGFTTAEAGKLTASELTGPIESSSSQLPEAQSLKDDMFFESKSAFGIPELRNDRLLAPPSPIKTWARIPDPEYTGAWLYNWGLDSSVGLDFQKTLIGFYCDDALFECFWSNPADNNARILKRQLSRRDFP
jgi:hypothetical protein